MAIFTCKMCGGKLDVQEGASIMECDSCGVKQTIPKLDNDKKVQLYDRANHFRRNNDFDKAMSIYEKILEEDATDAESYWSIVLCRYGIEYVEEGASRLRVPTVNRVQLTSILADEDYKSALKYAQPGQYALYEAEAKTIDGIQKGILEISKKEEPFDVFICYKETDAQGRRTQDSVLANDLYHQLTQEGFKVFFARITLEDKLGSAYEPYIFAALNSAKVMLVLGTKASFFNAVWVKNEWSRFLGMMKQDSKKLLIPAYRDMDPYDLPEEFSHLQAQDMSKLGFTQDIIRGIKKILAKPVETARVPVVETVQNSANIDAFLKRIALFLEDKEWDSAKEYCNKVLDIDPECVMAYAYRICANSRYPSFDAFLDSQVVAENNDAQKVLRFGDATLQKQFSDHNKLAKIKNIYDEASGYQKDGKFDLAIAEFQKIIPYGDTEQQIENCKESIYTLATKQQAQAQYIKAIKTYETILSYRDAEQQIENCKEAELQSIYTRATEQQTEGKYEEAIKTYESILSYRDAQKQIENCKEAILKSIYTLATKQQAEGKYEEAIETYESILSYRDAQEQLEQCRCLKKAEDEQKAEAEQREKEEAQRKKAAEQLKMKKAIIGISVIAVFVILCLIVKNVILPVLSYNKATTLLEDGSYEEAVAAFTELGDYKDSADMITETIYLSAIDLMNQAKYGEAIAIFTELGDYKDSKDMITETNYLSAIDLMNQAKYEESIVVFTELGDYKNSKDYIEEQCYQEAIKFIEDGKYEEAKKMFFKANGYQDAENYLRELMASSSASAGGSYTVDLKSDGTVVAVGSNESGQCDVENWTDIVSVSARNSHTVGLKSDGTVVAVGLNDSDQCDVENWTDVVSVSAGNIHTVGLKSDGTVVAVGSNFCNQCDVKNWTDIVAVSAGGYHTVGLKSDGTVVAVGLNDSDQCDVENWTDIVSISAGYMHTTGWKSDGTVVSDGWYTFD